MIFLNLLSLNQIIPGNNPPERLLARSLPERSDSWYGCFLKAMQRAEKNSAVIFPAKKQ